MSKVVYDSRPLDAGIQVANSSFSLIFGLWVRQQPVAMVNARVALCFLGLIAGARPQGSIREVHLHTYTSQLPPLGEQMTGLVPLDRKDMWVGDVGNVAW